MDLIVTGAGGFIGSSLVPYLLAKGHAVHVMHRGDLEQPTIKMPNAQAIIHLAGIAHAPKTPDTTYHEVNCRLTLRLAQAAVDADIKRFVFVSSSHAASHTHTAFGASKAEAERGLLALPAAPEIVVIRPTLVYGPNAKGNFGALARMASLPFPLPFAATRSRRSMVYIGNLCSALEFAAERNGLSGSVYTVTDPGEPLQLPEVIAALRAGLGRPRNLLSTPWLPGLLRTIGAGNIAEKIFGDSVFDGSALFAAGWTAPCSTQQGLRMTAEAMKRQG